MGEVKKQGMESLFVPYEIALKLKALGFDEPCFGSYIFGDKLSIKYSEDQFITESCCLAPTFSQAFRWFREKYGLFTQVERGQNPTNYYPIIDNVSHRYNADLWFDTYEEAELACLNKLIEICKNK